MPGSRRCSSSYTSVESSWNWMTDSLRSLSRARLGRRFPLVSRNSRSHWLRARWWTATCSSSAMFFNVAVPSLELYKPLLSELRAIDDGGDEFDRFCELGGPPNIKSRSGDEYLDTDHSLPTGESAVRGIWAFGFMLIDRFPWWPRIVGGLCGLSGLSSSKRVLEDMLNYN